MLPADRVALIGQLDIVNVLTEGKVERRMVKVGKQLRGEMVEVISGLVEGERVLPVVRKGS